MAEDQAAPLPLNTSSNAPMPLSGEQSQNGSSSITVTPIDSAVTQAEKLESKRHVMEDSNEPSAKRVKVDHADPSLPSGPTKIDSRKTTRGIAMIKAELVDLLQWCWIGN